MKSQILFPGKNAKNLSKCRLLNILPSTVKISLHSRALFLTKINILELQEKIVLFTIRTNYQVIINTASQQRCFDIVATYDVIAKLK